MENDSSLKTTVITFDKNGKLLNEKIIAKHTNEGSIQTIAKNKNGEYFLSFSVKKNSTIEGQSISFSGNYRNVILKYNSDWQLMDMQYPADGTDVTFRVANSFNDQVFYSGHYRNEINFSGHKIENDGRHSLFMMSVK